MTLLSRAAMVLINLQDSLGESGGATTTTTSSAGTFGTYRRLVRWPRINVHITVWQRARFIRLILRIKFENIPEAVRFL